LRRGADVLAVSFNGDVGGVVTLVRLLLFDIELARRGEAGIGVSSVRGELCFFPLDLEDPNKAGWLSSAVLSTRSVDGGVIEAVCREEKVIGL
jgi:hypothetical protein